MLGSQDASLFFSLSLSFSHSERYKSTNACGSLYRNQFSISCILLSISKSCGVSPAGDGVNISPSGPSILPAIPFIHLGSLLVFGALLSLDDFKDPGVSSIYCVIAFATRGLLNPGRNLTTLLILVCATFGDTPYLL